MSWPARCFLACTALLMVSRPVSAQPAPTPAARRAAIVEQLRLNREHADALKRYVLALRQKVAGATSEPERRYWQATADYWTREWVRLMRAQGRLERALHRRPGPGGR